MYFPGLLAQESPLRIDAILAALRSTDKFQDTDLVYCNNFGLADEVAVKRAHSAGYYDLVRPRLSRSMAALPLTSVMRLECRCPAWQRRWRSLTSPFRSRPLFKCAPLCVWSWTPAFSQSLPS